MSDIEKNIRVSGDASGFESLIDQLIKKSEDMYGSMRQGAKEYSKNISEQSRELERLISLKESQFEKERDAQRIMLNQLYKKKAEGADEEEQVKLLAEKARRLKEVNSEYDKQAFIAKNVREQQTGDRAMDASGVPSGGGGGGMSGLGAFGMKAVGWLQLANMITKPISRAMGQLSQSLGISEFMGAGKFAEASLKYGEGLEEARTVSQARFGRTFPSATELGMSEEDVTEFALRAARVRGAGRKKGGGKRGKKKGTVVEPFLQELEAESAMGMDTGELTEMLTLGRYEGDNVKDLTLKFLNKAVESDLWGVSQRDFSEMGEKFEFYGSLLKRELQTTERIKGAGMSLGLMTAFDSASGGLSRGRLLERIMGFDQAISSPTNPFIGAMNFRALSGSGDLLTTMTRQAKGAFGEGNVADVLGQAQGMFGRGTRATEFYLARMMPSLMSNPEYRKALAGADPELFRNLTADSSVEEYQEAAVELGISPEQLREMAQGGKSDIQKTNAILRDLAAKLGQSVLDPLSTVTKNFAEGLAKSKSFKEGMVSFASSVDAFANAVNKFIDKTQSGEWQAERVASQEKFLKKVMLDATEDGELTSMEKVDIMYQVQLLKLTKWLFEDSKPDSPKPYSRYNFPRIKEDRSPDGKMKDE